MNFAEYAAIKAVNWSSLRHLDRSPAHYVHARETPREDTPSMRLGRAAHCAILEPLLFREQYLTWTGGVRRGKAWDEFVLQAGGKEVLTEDEASRCTSIANAVRRNTSAALILSGGSAEQVIEWTDAETGIACKARLDYLGGGAGTVADVKTARDASPRAFGRAAIGSMYHAQLAFYAEGVLATKGRLPLCHLVAVENEPPHLAQVYTLEDDVLELGREKVRELLRRLADCRAEDKWGGYADGPLPLFAPAWAFGPAEGGGDLSSLGLEAT